MYMHVAAHNTEHNLFWELSKQNLTERKKKQQEMKKRIDEDMEEMKASHEVNRDTAQLI